MKSIEVQNILKWIQSKGISDNTLSKHLGSISRSTLSKIRSDKYPDYTGDSILEDLRKIARDNGMPEYQIDVKVPTSTPRPMSIPKVFTPVPISAKQENTTINTPVQNIVTYALSEHFRCICGIPNIARRINCKCISCGMPYKVNVHTNNRVSPGIHMR